MVLDIHHHRMQQRQHSMTSSQNWLRPGNCCAGEWSTFHKENSHPNSRGMKDPHSHTDYVGTLADRCFASPLLPVHYLDVMLEATNWEMDGVGFGCEVL